MADCPHGMPSPASCMDCQYEGNMPPPPARTVEVSDPFPTRYGGVCSRCGLLMAERKPIVKIITTVGSEVTERYAHPGCAPEPTA